MEESDVADGISILDVQQALDRQPIPGLWGQFLDRLINAEIDTWATEAPPSTGIEVLSAAGAPSAEWWNSYLVWATPIHPGDVPLAWRNWFLNGGIRVNESHFIAFVRLVAERARASKELKQAAAKPTALHEEVGRWLNLGVEYTGSASGAEIPAEKRKPPHRPREMDHDAILGIAALLLKENPKISIGSAGASIAQELPPNPQTGKPRDSRGIERIIAPLFPGTKP